MKIETVQIGFCDAKLRCLFNDHRSLEAKFGLLAAKRIACRMGLLKAASRLSLVPRQPPILLLPVTGTTESFCVTIGDEQRLIFTAREQLVHKSGLLDLDHVTVIEIQGFEIAVVRPMPTLKAAQ